MNSPHITKERVLDLVLRMGLRSKPWLHLGNTDIVEWINDFMREFEMPKAAY